MIDVLNFLDWVARAGGIVAALTVMIGFFSREKWKQVLQRSLAEDLERLKSELAMSQAAYSASLAPQIEQIKHEFQQKMEAYKVSLIAETEAAKAREELRKSIAIRYAEVQFERLVALEMAMAPIASEILGLALLDLNSRVPAHAAQALAQIQKLGAAAEEAQMFLSQQDWLQIIEFRQQLLEIVAGYVGQGQPILPSGHHMHEELLNIASRVHMRLREQICELGKL